VKYKLRLCKDGDRLCREKIDTRIQVEEPEVCVVVDCARGQLRCSMVNEDGRSQEIVGLILFLRFAGSDKKRECAITFRPWP
jgi:hypothetical protein